MTRKQTLLLALSGVVAVLIGTRMAIVWAQQDTVRERAPSADNFARPPGNFQPVPPAPSNGLFTGPASMMPMMGTGMAVDDDPEMAELVQSEATLAHAAEELVARYADSETGAERKEIATALRNTLAKQFDAQRQRREVELRRIEDQVRKLREQTKKRDDARETIIDRRLDQILNEAEGLGWAPAGGTRSRNGANTTASDMLRRMAPAPTKAAPATR